MYPNVDFRECLKDSPTFRASVEDAEHNLDLLEAKLEKLIKSCTTMVESGKVHNNANSSFISGLKDLAGHFHDDHLTVEAFLRFTHVLNELQKFHSILLDQAHRTIIQTLGIFIKRDVRKVKEARKQFEKISNDLDTVLVKNSQTSRNKQHECEEINSIVLSTKSGFLHTAVDYVFQLNVLHSKKNFSILDTVLAYLNAQNTYIHQGFDLFADLEAYMKQVSSQVEELRDLTERQRSEMEKSHHLIQQKIKVNVSKSGKQLVPRRRGVNEVQVDEKSGVGEGPDALSQLMLSSDSEEEVRMEGYLFKRTSNTFKTWVRRWFQIQNNQLVYCKRSKDNVTVMEEDLRLCAVRPSFDLDRRFCFEVVSPARSHILQADSDNECTRWIRAIQDGVSKAYNDQRSPDGARDDMDISSELKSDNSVVGDDREYSSNRASENSCLRPKNPNNSGGKTSSMSRIQSAILQVQGNNLCCDCAANDPSWASINLGITLCIECSGIHRSLGVHVSKVRSITLDAWELDLVRLMMELGNTVVNRIYEAKVDESIATRPNTSSKRSVRESWIKAKYVTKSFIKRMTIPNADAQSRAVVARRWSVYKRKRKPQDGKTTDKAPLPLSDSPEKGVASTGESSLAPESRGAVESSDVFVFGTSINSDERWTQTIVNLEESDSEFGSDAEKDPDSRSTTSLEDISKLHPDMLLYKATRARNLAVMLEAIALGANLNWRNEEDEGRTPLIQAVQSSSMATVEFLLLNGAKVDVTDHHGQAPLHHATILGHTGLVCQFLRRNANRHLTDDSGKDSLMIAMETANADIVTVLKIAGLNEEMKESEDETVNEVFRDFTNKASGVPERLSRNK